MKKHDESKPNRLKKKLRMDSKGGLESLNKMVVRVPSNEKLPIYSKLVHRDKASVLVDGRVTYGFSGVPSITKLSREFIYR